MKIPIENCKVDFTFECLKEWSTLAPTDDPLIRRCDSCEQNVHYCETVRQAKHLASKGCCVAVDPQAVEYESDFKFSTKERRLGKIKLYS